MVNDVLLCASELATNAVLHSQSRLPGGTFTMRGKINPGAFCDEISTDPATGAGVAYVRLEAAPDPVRVRAAFVSDDDIRDMTATYTCGLWAEIPALTAGEAL